MPVARLTDLYYLQTSTWSVVSACYHELIWCFKIVMHIVTLHDYLLSHYITSEYQFLNHLMLYYHLINAQMVLWFQNTFVSDNDSLCFCV